METGLLIFLIVLGVIVAIGIVSLILYLISKSKGKIVLTLNKMEFTPGETITGTINLKLKKPLEAKSFNVGLLGTMKRTNYSRSSKGGLSRSTRSNKVFDFKKPVDGEKTYPGYSEYKFQLKIPTDVYKQSTGNQVADNLIKSVQILTGTTSRINWYVTANLEIPGFDISRKVRINIA
jgi:hypothetical protein